MNLGNGEITGVVDTGRRFTVELSFTKFTAGYVDPNLSRKYLRKFSKKFEGCFLGLSGVEKSLFIKKHCVKHLVTLSLLTKNQL